jgi:radical SAM protein with 4Fe4S-binding SPASM domain
MTHSDVYYPIVDRSANAHPGVLASPALPSVFTLEITTVCNNFCSGCANVELSRVATERKNNIGYMDQWKRVIDEIVALNQPDTLIRISGGEPTVHPDFIEIIKYIETCGVPFAVFSTGRWGHIRQQTEIIHTLSQSKNLIGVLISLHGHDAETHCQFTESVSKSFDETCLSIQKAVAAGIAVFTNTVIHKKNLHNIRDIADLSAQLGASYAVFNRFVAYEHPLLPGKQELIKALEVISNLSQNGYRCKTGNALPRCFQPGGTYAAPAGYDLCHISPDGGVRPDNFSHFTFGNIFEEKLEDIWVSDKADYFRNCLPDQCRSCAALSFCRGGLKSPVFQHDQFVDPLLGTPLTPQELKLIKDDEDKVDAKFRALTSD